MWSKSIKNIHWRHQSIKTAQGNRYGGSHSLLYDRIYHSNLGSDFPTLTPFSQRVGILCKHSWECLWKKDAVQCD